MAIPLPTIDDFSASTVITMCRKIVNYLINTIVPGINTAQSTADSASTSAGQASTDASSALATANQAQTTANNAQQTATSAQSTATSAQQTATNAQITANQANASATANAQKIQEIITQFNIMVNYIGADSELVTGTAPQPISTE